MQFLELGEIIPSYFGPNGLLSANETPAPANEKGLKNFLGENNCFLNVVIQSLWHLEPFRSKFRNQKVQREHKAVEPHPPNCVYCALEIIFTQYEFSEDRAIPPNALRQTLAVLFQAQSKFQLYEIDDAGEALEAILSCLHNELGFKASHPSSPNEKCFGKYCIAHKIFGVNMVEQIKCSLCGSSTKPTSATLFTAYGYVAALRATYAKYPGKGFCQLLSISGEDKRLCPNKGKCSNLCTIQHSITSLPEVFAVTLVWDSADTTLEDIETTLNMISWQIDLSNVFTIEDHVLYEDWPKRRKSTHYRLKGMICYYGKHYISYFYSFTNLQWFMFDDATVKPVGVDWTTIRERCLKGRMKPTVLFYEGLEPHENFSLLLDSSIHFKHQPFSSKDAPPTEKESNPKPEEPKTQPTDPNPPQPEPPKVDQPPQEPKSEPQLQPEIQPPSLKPEIQELQAETTPEKAEKQAEDSSISSTNIDTQQLHHELKNEMELINKNEKVEESSDSSANTKVENEIKQKQPEESFILLPSKEDFDAERDFVVTRTNWLYRRQERIFRFSNECFMRILPDSNTVKERFEYKDVLEVTKTSPLDLVIRFYSDKETQYLHSEKLNEILQIMIKKAKLHGHTFSVKTL